jgi:hypothetical protein
MSQRLVAIVAPDGLPDALHDLLVEIFSVAHPAAFDPSIAQRFGAGIVSAPRFVDAAPAKLPLGVWVQELADVAPLLAVDSVRALLTSSVEVAAAAGPKGILVPAEPEPFSDIRPLAPAVRERVRRARGLQCPAIAVIDDVRGIRTWCGLDLASKSVDSALACASAVVVRGASLTRAMAWGAPIVTDSATNTNIGAQPGRDLIIADDNAYRAATEIVGDEPRAAALGWGARSFYEERFDLRRAMLTSARALGLVPTAFDRVALLLDELGTPVTAASRVAAYDHLALFRG